MPGGAAGDDAGVAEVLGRAGGYCKGKSGTLHISVDPQFNLTMKGPVAEIAQGTYTATVTARAVDAVGNTASATGTFLVDTDMNLTFKTTLNSQIDFTIENDRVTAIRGDGIDAPHFREYMEARGERNAYGLGHVGWGMNPGARWITTAMHDKRDVQAVEFRALVGSFL